MKCLPFIIFMRVFVIIIDVRFLGAALRDSHLRLPLTIAVERENPSMDVVRLLHAAYPGALQDPGMRGRLPIHVALESPRISVSCVSYLLQQCPSTGLISYSKAGKGDSAVEVASRMRDGRSGSGDELYRAVLRCLPNYDPDSLRELNWAARRIAFVMLTDPSSSSTSPCQPTDSPRRLSHLRIKFQSSPVYVCANISELLGSSPASSMSPKSPDNSSIGKQNLFLKLYYSNEKLFRLAVTFL